MEYNIEKLDEAIVYYLTYNPDIPKSINQIYNSLCEEKICPDLGKSFINKDINRIRFSTICHVLDSQYDNIHKFYNGTQLYLMFSTKDKADIIKSNQSLIGHQNPIQHQFDIPNHCNIIDYILDNSNYYSQFSLAEFMDGKNTALHIVCKEGRLDLLNKILDKYDINIQTKNKDGQSIVELVTNAQIMKKLLDYDYSKKIIKLETTTLNLKNNNALMSISTSLTLKKAGSDLYKWRVLAKIYGYTLAALIIKVLFNNMLILIGSTKC